MILISAMIFVITAPIAEYSGNRCGAGNPGGLYTVWPWTPVYFVLAGPASVSFGVLALWVFAIVVGR